MKAALGSISGLRLNPTTWSSVSNKSQCQSKICTVTCDVPRFTVNENPG